MKVTLKQIAKIAGVSVHTASDILNGADTRYRAETQARVKAVAKRLGYRPNRQARTLRGLKSGTIGILKPVSVIQTASEAALFAGEAIYREGFRLLAHDVYWHEQGLEGAIDLMLDSRVEGILLVNFGLSDSEAWHQLKESGIPMVSLSGNVLPGITHVAADTFQGGRLLAEHLVQQGFRRIAFLADDESLRFDSVARRLAGVESVLREAGVPCEVLKVESANLTDNSVLLRNFMAGTSAVNQLKERQGDFDAVICTNDYVATALIRACQDARIRVPQDLAIAGFDNTALGQFLIPRLTTVSHPIREIAQRAVQTLVSMIRNPTSSNPLTIMLPCELVVRESCGARPQELRNPLHPTPKGLIKPTGNP